MNNGSGIKLDENKVKKRLKEIGMSVNRLALMAQCSASTVRNALKGRHTVSFHILSSLCKALKVKPDDISEA